MAKRKKPAKKAAAKLKIGPKRAAAKKPAPKKAAPKKVLAIPAGFYTVTPYLVCRNAAGAIDYYKKALGAKERYRMPGPDGKIGHAEILVGNSIIMLGDENPGMGASAPETLGGSATGLFIYTDNVDKAYAKAIAAGAKAEMPPTDMFWGDRYCKFVDPFGHKWSMATHIEDLSPKEMARRGAEFMAKQPAPPAAGTPEA